MALRHPPSRLDYAAFGWRVACPGQKPVVVRQNVRSMVDWATQTCRSYFPEDAGYDVRVESPAGPSNGVRLSVRRGDFRAGVVVETSLDPDRKTHEIHAVRMHGRAESEAIAIAERAGHQLVQRFRTAGVAAGLSLFAVFAWYSVGEYNPIFFLGGLLMVVAALLTTTAGGTLGSWMGERVADYTRSRALAATNNAHLKADLRRWRALARQLAAQRRSLSGAIGDTPFRALMPANQRPESKPVPVAPRLAQA